jgi:hypothetical protein
MSHFGSDDIPEGPRSREAPRVIERVMDTALQHRRRSPHMLSLPLVVLMALQPLFAQAQSGSVARASVSTAGDEANSGGGAPVISADGRYVTFESFSSNLVAGDTNGQTDVFVRDLVAGTTTRAIVSSGGVEVNNSGDLPRLSADGRYVVFQSVATNLVPGDTNGQQDIFVVRNPAVGPLAAPAISVPAGGSTTSSATPTISGTSESGVLVKVSEGVTTVGQAIADSSGNWTLTSATPLADGSHTVTAVAVDPAGNTSSASAPVSFTVPPPITNHVPRTWY